jgi:hypothetical protein
VTRFMEGGHLVCVFIDNLGFLGRPWDSNEKLNHTHRMHADELQNMLSSLSPSPA